MYTCAYVCCSVLQCECLLQCVAGNAAAQDPHPMYTRVSLCCSVLQCVAVCCSVLQCVAVCCNHILRCNMLQYIPQRKVRTLHIHVHLCVAVHCSALQCVAVILSVAVCCSEYRGVTSAPYICTRKCTYSWIYTSSAFLVILREYESRDFQNALFHCLRDTCKLWW